MDILARLSSKIGNNLVHSNVVKEEDAEIYIYGINLILVSVVNASSALIIGFIFGVFLEVAVFMAAFIPLRSFAGGYHAKTPLRCYIFSVITLVIISFGMRYLFLSYWVYYIFLATATLVVITLSPIEDKNKPLYDVEHKIYKKRVIFITAIELVIVINFRLANAFSLFIAVVYSFVVLSFMLISGKVKNCFTPKE